MGQFFALIIGAIKSMIGNALKLNLKIAGAVIAVVSYLIYAKFLKNT